MSYTSIAFCASMAACYYLLMHIQFLGITSGAYLLKAVVYFVTGALQLG
jgi:hypothetical protein